MKISRSIFALGILTTVIALSGGAYILYSNNAVTQNNAPEELAIDASLGTGTPPCSPCAPEGIARIEQLSPEQILNDLNGGAGALVSAGVGTTTVKRATPFNDILIAESGSPYATLRNARYTVWPYPGEIALKEVYIILPDTYTPIFPGYSNKQFIESADGTKHIAIYLRHRESTATGADAKIFVQSPIATNAPDQQLTLFEANETEAYFSLVAHGQIVIIEVSFAASGLSREHAAVAWQDLLRAIEGMEIVW